MTDWKYDLDEVGPEAETAGEELPPVEKGSPSPENVAFTLLGVLVALYVFTAFIGLV